MTLSEEIEELPEGVSSERLKLFFERVLACENKDYVFDALIELADRQWHAYEKVHPALERRIGAWLLSNWSRDSTSDAEKLTSIVARLGLESVYVKMKEELPNLPQAPRDEIQDFIDEVGESVSDPFNGMVS